MNRFLSELKRPGQFTLFEKVELGITTALFLIGIIAVLSEEITDEGSLFGIDYLRDILIISSFYFSFLLLNFIVFPGIRRRDSVWLNSLIIAVIIVISFLLFPNLENNFLLHFLAGYFTIKYGLMFLWKKFKSYKEAKGSFSSGMLVTSIFYLLLIFFMIAGNAERAAIIAIGILIPLGILLYIYSYLSLIPNSFKKKRPFLAYLGKVILFILAAILPLSLLGLTLLMDDESPFLLNVFHAFLQLFITVPLAWFTWKRHRKGKEEVKTLKKELGHSTAQFDFLRSQINPHFLFNALNTLYGTALQEKAERTGEGIQQLGDMMRFMLHENMQEKISLAREIEYLKNYINLQRLRTDPNPNMTIQADIQEPEDYSQISPMLLIPFVENAFKHGISFREPSHIKIALEKREKTIYFDVYNSKHQKPENDPEKDKSGIGLPNVRERLQLLYPGNHDLIIRETGKEYFVHLTIDLS